MALTPDEIHTARLMRRESKTIEQIARLMNRSRTSVGEACRGYARVIQQQARIVIVPDHVKAERDRRLALEPRDLTAAIAGDPLPGMSALERKRQRSNV